MAISFDRATLERTIRLGTKRVKAADLGRILRRSRVIRRLAAGPLGDLASDLSLMVDLIKDYVHGDYRDVPRHTVFAAAFALLYILNPFDLIPDFIPGIGYLDDGAVSMLVIQGIRTDLENYRTWMQKLKRRLRHMSAVL